MFPLFLETPTCWSLAAAAAPVVWDSNGGEPNESNGGSPLILPLREWLSAVRWGFVFGGDLCLGWLMSMRMMTRCDHQHELDMLFVALDHVFIVQYKDKSSGAAVVLWGVLPVFFQILRCCERCCGRFLLEFGSVFNRIQTVMKWTFCYVGVSEDALNHEAKTIHVNLYCTALHYL